MAMPAEVMQSDEYAARFSSCTCHPLIMMGGGGGGGANAPCETLIRRIV